MGTPINKKTKTAKRHSTNGIQPGEGFYVHSVRKIRKRGQGTGLKAYGEKSFIVLIGYLGFIGLISLTCFIGPGEK
jgi:hypothetical protein